MPLVTPVGALDDYRDIGASQAKYPPPVIVSLSTSGLATAGLRVGALLADPGTGVVYGQSDGGGGVIPISNAPPDASYEPQLSMYQRALPSRSVLASTSQIYLGTCAVASVRCITPGSAGTFALYDGTGSSDATLLRFSLAFGSAVAGQDYPLVADESSGRLFSTGVYCTLTTGGVYSIELIDGSSILAVQGSGLLTETERVTASGIALPLLSNIVSLTVIAPGSAGNLAIYDSYDASDATKLRWPVTAFGSLAANQIIRLGPKGGAGLFRTLYLTMPTAGIVLVNYLPR